MYVSFYVQLHVRILAFQQMGSEEETRLSMATQ